MTFEEVRKVKKRNYKRNRQWNVNNEAFQYLKLKTKCEGSLIKYIDRLKMQ